ncbi:MAG: hypothetical protein ACK5WS_02795 [Alphaproteobacteria bacterium]|nr:hypothetical protein [Candidatus Jidaibacter sp.]
MNKLLGICAVILISGFAVNTMAANEYEARRDRILNDKTIAEPVRKELKEYFEKGNVIYKDCKQKRMDLRNGLSADAKKALAKHKAKRKPKSSTENAATEQKK